MFTKILLTMSFSISATRILVTTLNPSLNYGVTGILTLQKKGTPEAIHSTHEVVLPLATYVEGGTCTMHMFANIEGFGFGVKCKQTVICCSGYNVYEWNVNQLIPIKPLNVERKFCSSVYVPINKNNHGGVLIVAGGQEEGQKGLESLEYLIMNDSFRSNKWRFCAHNLPHKVSCHQMNIFQNRLILTGGLRGERHQTNRVWEGKISLKKKMCIVWTPLPPMLESRALHVSVVIDDKLYCIGGMGRTSTEYYSFTNKTWQKGPDLPFELFSANVVVNQFTKHCFIVGAYYSSKVYLFDPEKGLVDIPRVLGIYSFGGIAVLL
jgi:hypothetical protein